MKNANNFVVQFYFVTLVTFVIFRFKKKSLFKAEN